MLGEEIFIIFIVLWSWSNVEHLSRSVAILAVFPRFLVASRTGRMANHRTIGNCSPSSRERDTTGCFPRHVERSFERVVGERIVTTPTNAVSLVSSYFPMTAFLSCKNRTKSTRNSVVRLRRKEERVFTFMRQSYSLYKKKASPPPAGSTDCPSPRRIFAHFITICKTFSFVRAISCELQSPFPCHYGEALCSG